MIGKMRLVIELFMKRVDKDNKKKKIYSKISDILQKGFLDAYKRNTSALYC
jgi:hypothetical protein